MRDDRARTVDLRVDRIVVRAHGSSPDAARELGAAIAQTLPAALADAAEHASRSPHGGPAEFAAALASRLARPKGGAR